MDREDEIMDIVNMSPIEQFYSIFEKLNWEDDKDDNKDTSSANR